MEARVHVILILLLVVPTAVLALIKMSQQGFRRPGDRLLHERKIVVRSESDHFVFGHDSYGGELDGIKTITMIQIVTRLYGVKNIIVDGGVNFGHVNIDIMSTKGGSVDANVTIYGYHTNLNLFKLFRNLKF